MWNNLKRKALNLNLPRAFILLLICCLVYFLAGGVLKAVDHETGIFSGSSSQGPARQGEKEMGPNSDMSTAANQETELTASDTGENLIQTGFLKLTSNNATPVPNETNKNSSKDSQDNSSENSENAQDNSGKDSEDASNDSSKDSKNASDKSGKDSKNVPDKSGKNFAGNRFPNQSGQNFPGRQNGRPEGPGQNFSNGSQARPEMPDQDFSDGSQGGPESPDQDFSDGRIAKGFSGQPNMGQGQDRGFDRHEMGGFSDGPTDHGFHNWGHVHFFDLTPAGKIAFIAYRLIGILLFVSYWLLCMIWAFQKSVKTGQNPRLWVSLTFFFNLIAIGLLYLISLIAGTCPTCGLIRQGNETYCRRCGQKFQTTCKSCGASLPINSVFCPSCGKKVEDGADITAAEE